MKKRGSTTKPASPRTRMLADLKKSGLDPKDGLGFEPKTEAECAELGLSRAGDGYKILYYSADGKLLSMFRYRYFDTEGTGFLKGAKLRRYDQPFGTQPEAYLPRLRKVDWKKTKGDESTALYIVEGEKKAACVTKYIGPCIGLGGVFNYGGIDLLPSLRDWTWFGRNVFIVFDADKVKKPLVRIAEFRLASVLTGLGARVFIKNLPPDGPKGADDFIVERGIDKFNDLGAHEFEKGKHLYALFSQYGLIRQGGMILEFPTAQHPQTRLHNVETFRVIEAHRKIERKVGEGNKARTVIESAAKEWLESSGKPTFESLTYIPGGPQVTEKSEFNTWRSSGIVPAAGDTRLFDELLAHLIPDENERTWAMQWFAYPLQRLGTKLATALLIWSDHQGNGKDALGETVGLLHGRHNYNFIEQQQLDDRFNGWLASRTFIHGSEVCGDRDSRVLADRIKNFITAEQLPINEKHQPVYSLPNFANFYLTSNHRNALFIDDHARRFTIIRAERPKLPDLFYVDYFKWRDAGGNAAILHKMLNYSLSGFNPKGHGLRNEARTEMFKAGRSDLQRWCHALKEDSVSTLVMHSGVSVSWAHSAFATTAELLSIYNYSCPSARVNQQQLGNELANAGFKQANNGGQVRIPGTDTKQRLWIISPLRAANIGRYQIGEAYVKDRAQDQQSKKKFARNGGR